MDPNTDPTPPTPESVEIVVPGPEPAAVANPEPELVVPGPEPVPTADPEPELVVPGPEPSHAPVADEEPEVVVPGPEVQPADEAEARPVPPPPPGALPAEPGATSPLGDGFASGPPRDRPLRNLPVRRVLLMAMAGILTLALLGAGYAFYALRGTGDVLATDVPADSAVYVTVYLDPSADQKLDLHRLIGTFPQLRGVEDGGIPHLVNGFLASVDAGLSYEKDVQPWLGSQVAFAGTTNKGFSGAVLIASKDDAAAARALAAFRGGPRGTRAHWRDESVQGITISVGSVHAGDGRRVVAVALVSHAVVIGNDDAFVRRIVETASGHGSDLASSATFADAIHPLPSDRLALGYVHLPTLMRGLLRDVPGGGGDVPGGAAALSAFRGMGVSISAEPDGFAVDVHVSLDPSLAPPQPIVIEHPNPALAAVPRGAYGVYAFQGLAPNLRAQLGSALGEPIRGVTERLGLQSALQALSGDGAFEVGPGGRYPGGALLLGSTNDPALQRFLGGLGDVLRVPLSRRGGKARWATSSHRGVIIHTMTSKSLRRLGMAPSYAVADGLAIVASSPKELNRILDARATGTNLQSSTTYGAAVAHVDTSSGSLLFVDLQAVGRGIRQRLEREERKAFDAETAPWLGHLRGIAMSQAAGRGGYDVRVFVLIG